MDMPSATGTIAPRPAPARAWTERSWQSDDGLTLCFRDYPGPTDRPPVIPLHGLTRNGRDSVDLAEHLAGSWRVIVPEMRGRGRSAYATDTASYTPLQYVADLKRLLDQENIARFVAIGTSLGGLMTMLLALDQPDRIAAAVLVDVGPQIEPEGLARIREYVGQGGSFPTWMHAARTLQELHRSAHPDYGLEDWLAMAKRLMALGANGRIAYDYDMGIAEPFQTAEGAVPVDMWPAFEALAGRPLLLVRGELSTILSEATAQEMRRRVPELEVVTVPRTGHAPTLSEPEALAAVERLLARVA
jgi:pimeloyl-ACP methyl ester carboxylesterase